MQAETHVGEMGPFSEEAFELAREYYDRLIIQHPNRKTLPHAVDERMFYPAMFSLWIYQVCEKSKRTRRQLQGERTDRSHSPRSVSSAGDAADRPTDFGAKDEAIRVEELAQAMEIAERLDQVIASPPFDRQANLLQLRGNVALWISNLTAGTGAEEDWDAAACAQTRPANRVSVADRHQRLTNAQRELRAAQAWFDRAAVNGAEGQARILSSIDQRLAEVTTYMQRRRPSPQDD